MTTVRTVYPEQTFTANPPKVCTQRTVTIDDVVCDSTRQKHRWNTTQWYDGYKRRRRVVETYFSLIEDQGKQQMSRGRVKIMGVARTSFMVAFWTAAVNLRVIDTFKTHVVRTRVLRLTRKPRRNRAVPASDVAAGKKAPSRAGPYPAPPTDYSPTGPPGQSTASPYTRSGVRTDLTCPTTPGFAPVPHPDQHKPTKSFRALIPGGVQCARRAASTRVLNRSALTAWIPYGA